LAEASLHFQGVDLPPLLTSKVIDKKEANIMPGQMILAPRVSETCEQKTRFRHGSLGNRTKNEPKMNFGSWEG
jgi:hypothetical protein